MNWQYGGWSLALGIWIAMPAAGQEYETPVEEQVEQAAHFGRTDHEPFYDFTEEVDPAVHAEQIDWYDDAYGYDDAWFDRDFGWHDDDYTVYDPYPGGYTATAAEVARRQSIAEARSERWDYYEDYDDAYLDPVLDYEDEFYRPGLFPEYSRYEAFYD